MPVLSRESCFYLICHFFCCRSQNGCANSSQQPVAHPRMALLMMRHVIFLRPSSKNCIPVHASAWQLFACVVIHPAVYVHILISKTTPMRHPYLERRCNLLYRLNSLCLTLPGGAICMPPAFMKEAVRLSCSSADRMMSLAGGCKRLARALLHLRKAILPSAHSQQGTLCKRRAGRQRLNCHADASMFSLLAWHLMGTWQSS